MNYNYWKAVYKTLDFFGKEIEIIDFILSLVAVVIGLIWLIVLIIYLVKKKQKKHVDKKNPPTMQRRTSSSEDVKIVN